MDVKTNTREKNKFFEHGLELSVLILNIVLLINNIVTKVTGYIIL